MLKWLHEQVASWSWLPSSGPDSLVTEFVSLSIFALIVILLSLLANAIAKKVILRTVEYLIEKSENTYDDILLETRVFSRLSHIAPALVFYMAGSIEFADNPDHLLGVIMTRGGMIYMVLVIARVLSALLNTAGKIYQRFEISKQRPIKGIIQAIKVVVFLCALILVIASLIDKSPLILFSGLGAVTAVLLLVFKDAILGFVAGVQLASNNMIVPGDWISVPKCGADGDVIDVTLTTVQVQNWDKTITYVPIYKLVSDAFTNWRGMTNSGGRRIKRAIKIDLNTVRFCDSEMLERLSHFHLLKDYLAEKREQIDTYNKEHDMDMDRDINARRLTNLGTFRAYISAFLKDNPKIHKDMTFLVRQMEPTSTGIPMEIYVFSNDQRWAHYEAIQGDIFDHLLAVISEFDLAVYQEPSGKDFRLLTAKADESKPSKKEQAEENRAQNTGGDSEEAP